jgi:hypothetical protein
MFWPARAKSRSRMRPGSQRPPRGGVRVLITGPQSFERAVIFAVTEGPGIITERVRETIGRQ